MTERFHPQIFLREGETVEPFGVTDEILAEPKGAFYKLAANLCTILTRVYGAGDNFNLILEWTEDGLLYDLVNYTQEDPERYDNPATDNAIDEFYVDIRRYAPPEDLDILFGEMEARMEDEALEGDEGHQEDEEEGVQEAWEPLKLYYPFVFAEPYVLLLSLIRILEVRGYDTGLLDDGPVRMTKLDGAMLEEKLAGAVVENHEALAGFGQKDVAALGLPFSLGDIKDAIAAITVSFDPATGREMPIPYKSGDAFPADPSKVEDARDLDFVSHPRLFAKSGSDLSAFTVHKKDMESPPTGLFRVLATLCAVLDACYGVGGRYSILVQDGEFDEEGPVDEDIHIHFKAFDVETEDKASQDVHDALQRFFDDMQRTLTEREKQRIFRNIDPVVTAPVEALGETWTISIMSPSEVFEPLMRLLEQQGYATGMFDGLVRWGSGAVEKSTPQYRIMAPDRQCLDGFGQNRVEALQLPYDLDGIRRDIEELHRQSQADIPVLTPGPAVTGMIPDHLTGKTVPAHPDLARLGNHTDSASAIYYPHLYTREQEGLLEFGLTREAALLPESCAGRLLVNLCTMIRHVYDAKEDFGIIVEATEEGLKLVFRDVEPCMPTFPQAQTTIAIALLQRDIADAADPETRASLFETGHPRMRTLDNEDGHQWTMTVTNVFTLFELMVRILEAKGYVTGFLENSVTRWTNRKFNGPSLERQLSVLRAFDRHTMSGFGYKTMDDIPFLFPMDEVRKDMDRLAAAENGTPGQMLRTPDCVPGNVFQMTEPQLKI